MRSDSSALVIVHQRGSILHVGEIVEMRPEKGAPLKPSVVIRAFAKTMLLHGATFAVGDSHYVESVREYLDESNLSLVMGPTPPSEAYMRTRVLMRDGRVRIPRHDRLLQQLEEVQGKPTAGGGMSIMHPRNASGGHGDLVAAFVLAVWQISGDTIADAKPERGTREWEEAACAGRKARWKAEQEVKNDRRQDWRPPNPVRERWS